MLRLRLSLLALVVLLSGFVSCASTGVFVSPEECYNLGTAYFELGKYAEAETWYRKAADAKSTKAAALYQLGLVAFKQGRIKESAEIFEGLLGKDPENVMILRAAAYAWISAGNPEKAKAFYDRIAKLVPDSTGERYNYALVLYNLKEYEKAFDLLKVEVANSTTDDRNLQLLFAKTRLALGHPEAIDLLTAWLAKGDDQKVRFDLATACFNLQFYAKAVESYEALLTGNAGEKLGLAKGELRFFKARALIYGGDSNGITELDKAVTEGYADEKAIAELRAKAATLPPPAPAANPATASPSSAAPSAPPAAPAQPPH